MLIYSLPIIGTATRVLYVLFGVTLTAMAFISGGLPSAGYVLGKWIGGGVMLYILIVIFHFLYVNTIGQKQVASVRNK